MLIEKIINNNVVGSTSKDNNQILITGKGIGFNAKVGTTIDESKIEKIFQLQDDALTCKFKAMMENIPLEHIDVADDIISYTNGILDTTLNENIYLTLPDHISFAIKRKEQNQNFFNAVFSEVKTFYRKEFMIGMYALDMIEQKLGIRLPDDEAASIALHIVNAEFDFYMSDAMKSAKMIPKIIEIVLEYFEFNSEGANIYYERFIVHLKFLIYRILHHETVNVLNQQFIDEIRSQYPKEFECSIKVGKFIEEIYTYKVSQEELAYLTLHIRQVRRID